MATFIAIVGVLGVTALLVYFARTTSEPSKPTIRPTQHLETAEKVVAELEKQASEYDARMPRWSVTREQYIGKSNTGNIQQAKAKIASAWIIRPAMHSLYLAAESGVQKLDSSALEPSQIATYLMTYMAQLGFLNNKPPAIFRQKLTEATADRFAHTMTLDGEVAKAHFLHNYDTFAKEINTSKTTIDDRGDFAFNAATGLIMDSCGISDDDDVSIKILQDSLLIGMRMSAAAIDDILNPTEATFTKLTELSDKPVF